MKGVFFTDSSEDTLVKGIEAIFSGEYWLPRRVLCAHLERTRTVQRPASPAATLLTRKEMETLRLRSEEHTSELQSPCNLVCRLLLEKKKKTIEMLVPAY